LALQSRPLHTLPSCSVGDFRYLWTHFIFKGKKQLWAAIHLEISSASW